MWDLKPYAAYKDSGVPWLGMLPQHWALRRTKTLLRERSEKGYPDEPLLAATQTQGVVRKERYENRTVLALKDLDLLKLVRVGDFVISLRSFQGGIELAHDQGIISPAYTVLYTNGQVTRDYLACLFKSRLYIDNLRLYVTGIRQGQNLDYEKLSRSLLPLPPTDEQNGIVRYVRHVDRRISRYVLAKQRLIKLLEEQRQAFIHDAITRGLTPGAHLKPSGVAWLGDVPEDWQVLPLGKASESIQTGPFGSQLHAEDYVPGGTPIVNPSHMESGRIKPDLSAAVSAEMASNLIRHRLNAGDVVAARRGELGRCALVTEREAGWLCGTGSLRIRPKPTLFWSEYLMLLLSSQGVRDALSLSSIGATMENLNAGMVARLRLPCPPIEEQRRIISYINALSKKLEAAARAAQRDISLCREFRTRLIADVVTGKLDVREAAADLPDEAAELDDLPFGDAMEGADNGGPPSDELAEEEVLA